MDFEAHIVFIWMLLLKKSLACFLVEQFAEMFPLLLQLRPEPDGSTHTGPDRAHVGKGRDGMEAQSAQQTPLQVTGAEVGQGQRQPKHPGHQGAVRAG